MATTGRAMTLSEIPGGRLVIRAGIENRGMSGGECVKVVAAMSGGVDSAVAAALLVEQGHEVIGVHMKLHDQPPATGSGAVGTCCGLDDALDARRVADSLSIPFYVHNLRDAFKKAVMDDLAAQVAAGEITATRAAEEALSKIGS